MSQSAQSQSEHLAGAKQIEKGGLTEVLETNYKDLGDAIVFVNVVPDAINDTLDQVGEYDLTELDGSPLLSKGDEPLRCQRCGHLFAGGKAWSELFAHQGTACSPPACPQMPHPVKVSFPAARAPCHVQKTLESLGLQLQLDSQHHLYSFQTDVSLLQRRLHEMAFAEATCYNLEQWYESLQECTAETQVISLSDEDLYVLRKLHAAWHLGNHSVDNDTLAKHAALEIRVQREAWGQLDDLLFVKTSMRSPKDAVQVEHEEGDAPHVRLRREIAACCATNGPAAIELLIRSKRVMIDIANYLKYRSAGSPALNLILRQFDPDVANSVEWRCFIANGKMTAISQYHCYTALPEISEPPIEEVEQKLRVVRQRICDFQQQKHEVILNCIGIPSYVLDVATEIGGDASSSIRLIEVNPLHTSGAALFSWRHDLSLLLGQQSKESTELRVAKCVIK